MGIQTLEAVVVVESISGSAAADEVAPPEDHGLKNKKNKKK